MHVDTWLAGGGEGHMHGGAWLAGGGDRHMHVDTWLAGRGGGVCERPAHQPCLQPLPTTACQVARLSSLPACYCQMARLSSLPACHCLLLTGGLPSHPHAA